MAGLVSRKKIFFLIGADNLIKFHKWNNWKKIPRLAKLAIFPRQNYSIKSSKSFFMITIPIRVFKEIFLMFGCSLIIFICFAHCLLTIHTSNLNEMYGGRGLVARRRMTRRFHTPSSMTAIPAG